MIRKEALEKLWYLPSINMQEKIIIDKLLNEIYNDFESRTCSNCKFDDCGCSVQDSINRVEEEPIDFSNFGCIKFQRVIR
jgi:hypothetical protein